MPADSSIDPESLLMEPHAMAAALGPGVFLEDAKESAAVRELGGVLGAAAVGSAFRSYAGRAMTDEGVVPFKVGALALVFPDPAIAGRTFDQVAQVSHLRTRLGASQVSVETVTAPNGLVSYWCYLSLGPVLVILTLDTLDPVRVSMTEFRTIVTRESEHLERALPGG